jgi:outer membrane lipoprotein-sorting protein
MHRLRSLALLFSGLALGQPSAPAAPESILARVRARQAELLSLKARLVQRKSYPQLGIDDPPESGGFFLSHRRHETRARIDIESPERRILTVRDGSYVLYQPRIRQAVTGKLSGSGAKGIFAGVLTGSRDAMAELERSYLVSGAGVETLGERSVHHLKFAARPGASVYCQEIDLFVDVSLDLPIGQSCREANQALVTFTLSEVEINVPLDESLFEIDLPPDVERVKGGT